MLYILWKQILKYKNLFLLFGLFWLIVGFFIYYYRYQWVSFLYRLTTNPQPFQKQNPEKAYHDFFLPAVEILEKHQVNLKVMKEICPQEIQSTILIDDSYRWDFIKKYNLFSFEKNFITVQPTSYWQEKQQYVNQAILLLKEAIKYAYIIPENITKDQKRILLPLLLQECFDALCLPQEGKPYWYQYILYWESRYYNEMKKQNPQAWGFPFDLDLNLLEVLRDEPNYKFALVNYVNRYVPHEAILKCPSDDPICNAIYLEEYLHFFDKLIFVSEPSELGTYFLSQARLYVIKGNQTQQKEYWQLALDRYKGASEFSNTQIDAYLEMVYVLLNLGRIEEALQKTEEFLSIKPSSILQEDFYRKVLYLLFLQLNRYEEASCIQNPLYETPFCKSLRKKYGLHDDNETS
ncbi:MAG: hypothetical protein NZ853_09755 [Leptospiraceae bacterium]|nr:hypothetical protein [Leptospiraceae bacterium]MDW7976980.1 hypothetical protein [Leptospiraceae bacterium]